MTTVADLPVVAASNQEADGRIANRCAGCATGHARATISDMQRACACLAVISLLGCSLVDEGAEPPARTTLLEEPYTLEVEVRARVVGIFPLLPERCTCNMSAWPADDQCATSSDAIVCHCDDAPRTAALPWTCITAVHLRLNDGEVVVEGEAPQPFGSVRLPDGWLLADFDDAELQLFGCGDPIRIALDTSPARLVLSDMVVSGDEVAITMAGEAGGDALLFGSHGMFGGRTCRSAFDLAQPWRVMPATSAQLWPSLSARGLWLDAEATTRFGRVRAYRSAGFSLTPPWSPPLVEERRWQLPVHPLTPLYMRFGGTLLPDEIHFTSATVTADLGADAPEHTLAFHADGEEGQRLTYRMGQVDDEIVLETSQGSWAATVPHVPVEGMIRPGTDHFGAVRLVTGSMTLVSDDGTQDDVPAELTLELSLPSVARPAGL